jgi:23S rRNA (cytosine1962-C5)-methyltransferase
MGLSALLVKGLVEANFPMAKELENGELYFQATSGVQLPLGILSRYTHGL